MVKMNIFSLSIIIMLCGIVGFTAVVVIYSPSDSPVTVNQSDLYSGVLVVQTNQGQGSCFVVAHRNDWFYAVTAAHVVGQNLTVDEQYEAEVMRVDRDEDVALIRFKSLEIYRVYEIARARLEESCTAIGWSRGSQLVYKGYIACLDFDGHIVANGGIVPGCSGGPLLNKNGRVIGVTVAFPVYRNWGFDSTALYVPSRFVEALIVTIKD